MNEMVDEMVVMMKMRWNKERKRIFFFGKHEVSGDPDFHLRFSA